MILKVRNILQLMKDIEHLLQYFPEARFNEEVLFHDADRVMWLKLNFIYQIQFMQ